ncbi:MAG: lipid A deacylase LpxR family protein [Geminicoccaceae bacterium]
MTSRVGSLGGLTKSISVATLISLFLLANPGIALAVDKPGLCDTVTAQLDNDEMGGTDRNYTGAFRMACVTSPPRFLDGLMPPAPDTGAKTAKRLAYALGTSVYTPDDLSRSDLIEDDQPYAGWLYLGFALERDVVPSSGPRYLDNLELQLGVVGPYSGAEHLQSLSHEVFGATDPQGWGNQLDNEPGVNLFYSRQWTGAEVVGVGDQNGDEGLLVDVTPELGLGLGNIHIFGAAGLSFRFGDFLPDDHGPNTLRPSLPGSDSFPQEERFSAYLFGGVEGRVVARNIFLDGNTFQDDGPSVDKNILVGEARLGLAMTYDNLRFAYTQVFRSQEFDGQSGQVYGSFTLSIAL